MKNRVSKLLILLCAVLLAAIVVTTNAVTASATGTATVYSGACGTNLTWEFDSGTGTLTIDGTGAMSGYSHGSAPWYAYRTKIAKIVVNNGITSISNGAFYGCSSLEEITLPFVGCSRDENTEYDHYRLFGYIFGGTSDTGGVLTSQYYSGSYTISYCIPASLTKVTITDASGIYYGAFSNCSTIEELILNDEITTIEDRAFYRCTKLDTFKLPASLTTLGSEAMYNCDSLTDIEIPSGVTTIDEDAFYSCDTLSNVKLHADVTTIGNYAFADCSALKNVDLPENLESIGSSAFRNCNTFESIIIPDKVETIGSYAFDGCSNVYDVIIGKSVATISAGAFSNLGIIEVTVPNSVVSIGSAAFSGCSNLEEMTLPFVGCSRDENTEYDNYRLFGYIFGGTSYTGGVLTSQYYSGSSTFSYYIPASLTKVTITDASGIYYGAFSNCSTIEELILNDEITTIEDRAFYRCTKLDTFKLPASLTTLGSEAMYNCDSLTDIEIPSGVTTIDEDAFYSCDTLSNVKLHADVTTIGNYAFADCSALKNVDLPENLESIGSSAFRNCNTFESIIIPDKVETIGSYAFDGCSNVYDVIIGKSVATISAGAFSNLGIIEVTVPNSVVSIGSAAFSGCSNLEEMTLPFVGCSRDENTEYDRYRLFGYIFGGTSYTGGVLTNQYYSGSSTFSYYIPASLTKVTITDASGIYYGAFSNCSTIEELILNDGIITIEDHAFDNLGMITKSENDFVISGNILLAYKGADHQINVPAGIKIIAPRAFYNNKTLGTVTLADDTDYIGAYAFYNCTGALVKVPRVSGTLTIKSNGFTYTGSVEYLDEFSFTNGNDTYSYTVDGEGNAIIVGCTTTSTNITLPNTLGGYPVTAVGYKGMANCTTLKGITIPNNIIKLDLYAFAGCTGIDTVTIPATCVYIGKYAFSGCTNLTTVVIAEGVTHLGDYCFENCESLTEVVVPDSCTYLGDYAFYNCVSMESATIGITVPAIGNYVFYNCQKLATVVIGIEVQSIGDYAFYNTALTRLTTPNTLKHIGDYAFASCDNLERVALKTGLLTIGDGAFMGNAALATINWPANINSIGAYAFHGCSSLESATIPAGVSVINDYTFAYCSSLTNITFKGTITTIGNKAFYRDALTSVTLTDGLTSIGADAFAFNALPELYLPSTLTYIGEQAFNECTALASVSMPDSVGYVGAYVFSNNANDLTITIRYNSGTVAPYMLYNSDAYKVVMEDGITEIGSYAFALCHELTEITFPNTLKTIYDYAFYDNRLYNELTLPNTVESIGSYAFARGYRLERINIPDSVQSIGTHAFMREEANDHIDPDFTVHFYYNKGVLCDNILDGQDMHHIIVADNIHTIGNNAFSNASDLVDITVPDTIASFGNNCFQNDTDIVMTIRTVDGLIDNNVYNAKLDGVVTVKLDDSNVGDYAFAANPGLRKLTISATSESFDMTSIGSHAFDSCKSIGAVVLPSTVKYIGSYAFYDCNSMSSINIPNGIEKLLSHTFYGCASLGEIGVPNSVTAIEDYAFYGCVVAKSITLSNQCKTIGEAAFYNCKALPELNIPDSVTSIGAYAFRSCGAITELVFSDNVDTIGACAFYDCNGLQTVKLGKKIIELGDRMFYGCVNLESLYVYAPLSYIDTLAFYGADFVTVYCGRDDYMINFFDENGIMYEVLDDLVYEYKITFVNNDGEIISSATYTSGSIVTLPANPTKPSDNTYNYVFAGWDQDVTIVGGNKTYTAVFTPVYIDYTVVFKDYNGNILSAQTYHYGDAITIPSDPTRAADNTYTYAFAGWDNAVVDCTANAVYTATYTPTYIDYTIVFEDWDGTIISTKTYHYGDEVTAPSNPTKEADNTYTYAFAGWDKEVDDCTGNVTYTATYNTTYIDYTVEFMDADGTVISTQTYHYGDKVIAPTEPQKAADNSYTYAFAGWDKAVVDCVGNATYTATYTPTYIDYTVVFKNWNGAVITAKTYHWGDEVTVPADPVRAADNTYTYAFAGWDSKVVNCAGNVTYTATYTPAYIDYIVIFENADGSVISKKIYHWGEEITIPADPMKDMDHIGSYSFAGWDKNIVACDGNATYTATYAIDYTDYTVVFQNWDGDVISTETYHWGDSIVIPANPTKAADNTYTYLFAGWDNEVVNCAGTATYTATYTPVYINYTIVFKNWDDSVLSTKTYHWGDVVTTPTNPTKAADNTYTYAFTGWDRNIVDCAGNATYIAQYDAILRDYTVVFKDWNGTVLSSKTYHWGDQVAIPPNPTRAADNTYTYTFAGWDSDVVNCAGNATYTATYNATYIDYTVVFKDWNGEVLSTKKYHYGDKITAPTAPAKAADNTYTYSFAGWDKTVVNCAGNATYTATYNSNYINYTVVFKNWNGTVLSSKTYHYGDKVTVPTTPTKAANNTYTYTFAGWDKTIVNCAGNATYTATYTQTYIDYTVTFKNWDGSVIATDTYHYGDVVQEPNIPTKDSDLYGTYVFSGWDKAVTNCAGNATYTATYKVEYTDYLVSFQNWDGTLVSSKTYHYGDTVVVPIDPVRTSDNTYTYTFIGWDKDVVNCAGNTTYIAQYDATLRDYTITFRDWNGNLISSNTYHWGDQVIAPADPIRESDNTYTYSFSGWDRAVANCAGNATYTATFKAAYIDYTVVFKNWDDTVISSETYHWGDVVEQPQTPIREQDQHYIYTFSGWDTEVVSCAGNAEYKATYAAKLIPAKITSQPKTQKIKSGAAAKFIVEADGIGLTYQWQSSSNGKTWKNCSSSSATKATFSFTSKTSHNGNYYRCKVTDGEGNVVYTSAVRLYVLGITTQPNTQKVKAGATVKFTVKATGTGLKYQWQSSTNGKTWKNCSSSSATKATFTFTSKTSHNGNYYRCKVTDSAGNVVYTSSVRAYVLGVTTQPKTQKVESGETVKFTVKATGTGLKYQWQVSTDGKTWKNCTSSSAKKTTFSFTTKTSHSGNYYRCKVTDSAGNVVFTSAVRAYVLGIKDQPDSKTVTKGKIAKFTVETTGHSVKYQWQVSTDGGKTWKNCSSSSAKKATFSFTTKTSHNGNYYRCKITDSAKNTIYTSKVKLTVKK